MRVEATSMAWAAAVVTPACAEATAPCCRAASTFGFSAATPAWRPKA